MEQNQGNKQSGRERRRRCEAKKKQEIKNNNSYLHHTIWVQLNGQIVAILV